MKIAISSTGNSLDSKIDRRFGRCNYFVIYDIDTKSIEFIPNPNKEVDEGAGPASVKIVAEKNAKKIVSGEFGIKIKPMLDGLNIQMIAISDKEKSVEDIINMLDGKL